MSSTPEAGYGASERTPPSEIVAGYLASFSIFASLISLAWHPLRLVGPAMLLALVSTAMTGPARRRLALAAVIVSALCFFAGMAISVVVQRPLW